MTEMLEVNAIVFENLANAIMRSDSLSNAVQHLLIAGEIIGLPQVSVTPNLDSKVPIIDQDGLAIEKTALGWPDELINVWYAQEYSQKHPDARNCLTKRLPFIGISDIKNPVEMNRSDYDAIKFTEEFGIRSQIMVPVHSANGQAAFVSWNHSQRGVARSVPYDYYGGLMCLANTFINRVHREQSKALIVRRKLSSRQIRCIDLVAEGDTAKEIAYKLSISLFTVQDHIKSAMKKIGAKSSSHAVAITRYAQ